MSVQPSIKTLCDLIAFPSVSSTSNAAVTDFVSQRLAAIGFNVERTTYQDELGVDKHNLVAVRNPIGKSQTQGGLAYFCHTDVVPVVGWNADNDAFDAAVTDTRIIGRGSCDMKGSLAAMLAAAESVSAADQTSPLWVVCTADEEVGFQGAKHVVAHSAAYRDLINAQPMGIIGEPTRLSVVHAHKGIVGFEVISRGHAAHSSLALGTNANEAIVPVLQKLLEICERTRTNDSLQDVRFDPPVLSWNFGVSDGATAINIKPDKSKAWVCFRPMPEIDGQHLIEEVRQQADALHLEFRMYSGGQPLWVDPNAPCVQAMCAIAGGKPKTVCYGTDGGEFQELNQMVVFGPGDIAQAHTTDEYLEIDQLEKGIDLYTKAIGHWCCASTTSS